MIDRFSAPWHSLSFERFLSEHLPALLAERLPLAGYTSQPVDEHTCRVTIEINANSHTVTVDYPSLPRPDEQGVFLMNGEPFVVIPIASQEELDQAAVQCVGEQFLAYLAVRMGQASTEMSWDEAVARAFLPLDAWFNDFLRTTAQRLDTTNWHSLHTHLRRILIPSRKKVVAPGQQGRVDPFETPEGPYIGRVFTIALGAEIRGEQIVIIDDSPEAGLGHNAAQIPFLEHDDANRLLMGVNMMRQALVPPNPEPALVQTGNGPEAPSADFWCGRNLLTAFVAWGEGSTEDGLILSESAAQRMNYPYPAEAGDKLSNRHGTKGVVSQVLSDEKMPHLADGTPIEIVFSFTGLHTRMNFGQVREAVMGRIARAEGRPAIIPPFHAPTADEIRARLVANGLPESGMERLRAGKDGPEMPSPATVGWVYWYRLAHLARGKMRAIGGTAAPGTEPPIEDDVAPHPVFQPWENGQFLGELEIGVLRQVGALVNAREALTTRAARGIQVGLVDGSPYFQELSHRLAATGIVVTLQKRQLVFQFQEPAGADSLKLARRFPHPWLRERPNREKQAAWISGIGATAQLTGPGAPVTQTTLTRVGAPPQGAGPRAQRAFAALTQSNDRMARWLSAHTPNPIHLDPIHLVQDTEGEQQFSYVMGLSAQLYTRLCDYLDALLPPEALQVSERQAFSGRAVIAPGIGLRLDQVGLPETIARALFAAQAAPGNDDLDEAMARSWVIIHRAPAVTPTSLLAFHPVRVPDPAIRLHPQACALLNADFDGDQVAVYLPLSEAAQREAGEKLSIAAHLRRDPELVELLLPPHEGIWGLARLSLGATGRRQIVETLRLPEDTISAPVQQSELAAALRALLDLEGPETVLRAANMLAHLGYANADASGASLSPFAESQVPLPEPPQEDTAATWEDYLEACAEAILSGRDYNNPNLGPQLLSAAVRPRSRRFLPFLVGPRGPVTDAGGKTIIVRHSLVEGRTAQELYATTAGAREGLARLAFESEEILQEGGRSGRTIGGAITILARARRSKHPGIVFARAAASGEVDPLTGVETRLLLGL